MSSYSGDLSSQQEAALAEFREAVAPLPNKPMDDDHYYLRWLRARKFNVKKAVTMFKNHLEMRKKLGADTIIQDWTPPEVLQKCFPGGFFGEDRDGDPVWYDSIGNLDFRGLHRSCKKEDILKLKCLHQELGVLKLKEFSEKKGRRVDSSTIVLDFGNLSLQKHYYWPGIEMVKEVLAMGEAGDPECIKRTCIVRAPSFFPMCYNVVKHVLGERTRQKVLVLGSNWKEELQKYISPDQLPQAFGGTRCEPDPWCTNYINPGYDVPPKYYLTNLTETDRREMDRVVVGRGGGHKVLVEVQELRSIIKWEFVSSNYDIGFGVYIKTEGKNGKTHKEDVFPVSRRESHIIPEVGTHVCLTAGTYVFKFDNSYSWTRSKEVFYSVKLFSPNEEPHAPAPPTPQSDHTPKESEGGEDEFFECAESHTPESTPKLNNAGNQATVSITTETVTIETVTTEVEPVSRTIDTVSVDVSADQEESGVSTAPIEVMTNSKETTI